MGFAAAAGLRRVSTHAHAAIKPSSLPSKVGTFEEQLKTMFTFSLQSSRRDENLKNGMQTHIQSLVSGWLDFVKPV